MGGFFTGIFAIITAIVVVLLSLTISRLVGEKLLMCIAYAGGFGLISWIIGNFSPRIQPGSAMLLLALGIILVIVLCVKWFIVGSTIKELVFFTLLDLLLMWNNLAAAARIYDIASTKLAIGVVMAIPKIAFVLSVGFFIANIIWFKDHLKKASEEDLKEELNFIENPLSIFKEEYKPLDELDEAENGETPTSEDGPEEAENLEEPIDFGFIEQNERGYSYVS